MIQLQTKHEGGFEQVPGKQKKVGKLSRRSPVILLRRIVFVFFVILMIEKVSCSQVRFEKLGALQEIQQVSFGRGGFLNLLSRLFQDLPQSENIEAALNEADEFEELNLEGSSPVQKSYHSDDDEEFYDKRKSFKSQFGARTDRDQQAKLGEDSSSSEVLKELQEQQPPQESSLHVDHPHPLSLLQKESNIQDPSNLHLNPQCVNFTQFGLYGSHDLMNSHSQNRSLIFDQSFEGFQVAATDQNAVEFFLRYTTGEEFSLSKTKWHSCTDWQYMQYPDFYLEIESTRYWVPRDLIFTRVRGQCRVNLRTSPDAIPWIAGSPWFKAYEVFEDPNSNKHMTVFKLKQDAPAFAWPQWHN